MIIITLLVIFIIIMLYKYHCMIRPTRESFSK